MKASSKKWLLISGGIVVLLGLVALAAPFFIPWAKLKDQAATTLSQRLGRTLSIGAVDVGFFSGVHVRAISLANAPGDGFSAQPLFSVADAKLSVSLLSILTGKLVISSITFEKPQILVETNAAGVSNLKGLGGAAAAADKASEAKAGASKPGSLPLVLASLHISDGDIVIRDKQKKTETAVHGLDLKLYGLSLAAAGGSRLELALDAVVEGKKIPLSAVCNFKLDLAGDSVEILSLDVKAPALSVTGKGSVAHFSGAPSVDLGVKLDLALADLSKLLPPSALKKIPGELKSAGTVSVQVQAKGALAQPQDLDLQAQLAFNKVDLAYGSYPGLSGLQGTLSVTKSGADLPALDFKLGGDPVHVQLKASWGGLQALMAGPAKLKADVDFKLSAPKLNLDPILPIVMADDTPAEAAAKAEAAKDTRLQDLRDKVPAGLSLRSLIEVGALQAKGVSTGAFKQQLALKGRQLQSATDLALYDGQFWERTSVDFNTVGPVWKSQSGLSKLAFAPFIKDLATALPEKTALKELDGKLSGNLGFKAEAQGKGISRGTLKRNLTASADFFMKDGLLKKTKWQEDLASVIPHPQTQAVLRSDISFANAVGKLDIGGGRTTLKSLTLGSGDDWRGGDLLLQASGFRTDDGTLDFKVTPHFSPQRVQLDGAVGDAFKDSAGWVTYDYIAYYGPAGHAKADFKAGLTNAAKKAVSKKVDEVKKQATDAVKEKAGQMLKGLFGQ